MHLLFFTGAIDECNYTDATPTGYIIYGLYNTTAGQNTGGYDGRYPALAERPSSAVDNNTLTKYVNFGNDGCFVCTVAQPGQNTGFFIIPPTMNYTVAHGLLFATGNDAPNRDPLTVTLEGSNKTDINQLQMGSSWTLIYNGSTGITSDPGRFTYGTPQNFSNTIPSVSYRLLITSQRGPDLAVQYSEAHILGFN
jgi:hypothetical protein